MNVKITPKVLSGEIDAISSKSYAHRTLIATALSGGCACDIIYDSSKDIDTTRDCLLELRKDEPIFDCRESGSTLRFLLPIAGALKNRATFLGSKRLDERPLSPLKEQLKLHGCSFSAETNEGQSSNIICHISGKLKGGRFILPGDVSSQFVTGLLFALPLLEEDSEIVLTSPLQSADYVEITLKVLEDFGIAIDVEHNVTNRNLGILEHKITENNTNDGYIIYKIKGRQKYTCPSNLTVEGDWSNAAFWIAAGINVKGLNLNSLQGDKEIRSFIEVLGGPIVASKDSMTSPLSESLEKDAEAIVVDATNIPDLIPILSVVAAVTPGKETKIINAKRLRLKESDRLHAIYDCLMKLGADIKELPDGLIIKGKNKLYGGTVSGFNDHRIVMSMAIASICCENPVIIEGAEAVNKSYPRFFEDFKKLGGDIIDI